jgi:hypothetical protein
MVLWLRDGLTLLCAPAALAGMQMFRQMGIAPVLQGLGTALILAIVALARDRDEQTRAAASAEVRALQSRMNPHFLFNALNTLAALATIAPREIPRAAGRLRHFLRAGFDQPERALVPLEEELTVVRAYLDIESLRLGNRLRFEQAIDPGLTEALIPPFSLQPLVENAVQHGLQSLPKAGCLRLVVRRRMGEWLDMSISDDGQGCPRRKSNEFSSPWVRASTRCPCYVDGCKDCSVAPFGWRPAVTLVRGPQWPCAFPCKPIQRCAFNTAASRAAPAREAVISVPARSRSRTR